MSRVVITKHRRWLLEKGAMVRRVALHLLFGALVSMLQLVAYNFVFQLLVRRSSNSLFPLGPFQEIVVGQFHFNLLLYFVVIGLYQAFNYYRRFRKNLDALLKV